MTTRAELERRVDELAAEHSGRAFADAVERYAESLGSEARDELGAVLLERAGGLEQAVHARLEARGWLRRTWTRMGGETSAVSPRLNNPSGEDG